MWSKVNVIEVLLRRSIYHSYNLSEQASVTLVLDTINTILDDCLFIINGNYVLENSISYLVF